MKSYLKKLKRYLDIGRIYLNDPVYQKVKLLNDIENKKAPRRSDIINFLLGKINKQNRKYLEIGVRRPNDNFSLIKAEEKFGVDPGIEFKENPVEYKMTSDEFFQKIKANKILHPEIKFDLIFVDGLHLAEQVEKDVNNALSFLSEDGFIVMHDCNPPTEWHTRVDSKHWLTPAGLNWNGTVWKAFVKIRARNDIFSCCVDTDWGVGVLSKKVKFGEPYFFNNSFFEFSEFEKDRKKALNLFSFDEFLLFFEKKTE